MLYIQNYLNTLGSRSLTHLFISYLYLSFFPPLIFSPMPRKSKAPKSKRNIKNPCGIFSNPVASNHKPVWCDNCHLWIHISCNNTSSTEYQRLQQDHNSWFCQKCFNSEVPFGQSHTKVLNSHFKVRIFNHAAPVG